MVNAMQLFFGSKNYDKYRNFYMKMFLGVSFVRLSFQKEVCWNEKIGKYH